MIRSPAVAILTILFSPRFRRLHRLPADDPSGRAGVAPRWGRQRRPDYNPRRVDGDACIAQFFALILWARDFSPRHGGLLAVFANTGESQPAYPGAITMLPIVPSKNSGSTSPDRVTSDVVGGCEISDMMAL